MNNTYRVTLCLGLLFSTSSFAAQKNSDIRVNANTIAGCALKAEDVHFGVIDFTAELLSSGNRVLFVKDLNVQYQCSPGVSGKLSSSGIRNIYNTNDRTQLFHFDTTYINAGIHTVPYSFTATGLLQEVPIGIKIMNPTNFGNGILPLAGEYVGQFNLTITY